MGRRIWKKVEQNGETTLHERYIYRKTPDGCKGGWTCAQHAPEGRGAERRLRVNYRYYNPADGRWTRKDPIEVTVKLNLYSFSFGKIDILGLEQNWGNNWDLIRFINHYRHGEGEPVRIDFSSIDTSDVNVAKNFSDIKKWLKEQIESRGGLFSSAECKEGSHTWRTVFEVRIRGERQISETGKATHLALLF